MFGNASSQLTPGPSNPSSPTTHSTALPYSSGPPSSEPPANPPHNIASVKHQSSQPVDNLLYDQTTGWTPANSKPHPRISLKAAVDHSAYHAIQRSAPVSRPTTATWVSDTGCMSCLAPPRLPGDMNIDSPIKFGDP